MNFRETMRTALLALARNRLRSFLTTLGIIIGVFSVITLVAVGEGSKQMVNESLKSFGTTLVMVLPGNHTLGGVRSSSADVNSLSPDDAKAILRECPDVVIVSPLTITAASMVYGNQNWSSTLQGTGLGYPIIRNWAVSRGSFFTETDIARANRVCVLGQTVARKLFGDADPVNKLIRLKKMPFRVLGVLETKGQTGWGQDQDDQLIAPYTTVMKKVAGVTYLTGIHTMARGETEVASAIGQISEVLRRRHKLRPEQEADFSTFTSGEIQSMVDRIYGTIVTFLGVVASITLFVGGIGIMNIMLVSVTERFREIGLRIALGARGRDILLQFLLEAVLLAILGGAVGVISGIILAELVSYALNWPVLVDPISALVAFAVSGLIGVIFGFFPAWRASQLDPIEALRTE
jgi:putative ABC transport system permease protein